MTTVEDRVCKDHSKCVLGVRREGNATHDTLCIEHIKIYVVDLDGIVYEFRVPLTKTIDSLVDDIVLVTGMGKDDVHIKNETGFVFDDTGVSLGTLFCSR